MSRMSYHLSQQAKIVTALANCTGKQRKGKSWHSHSPCLALRRIWISPLWKEQGGFIQVIRKRELRDVQPISSLTRRIRRIIWSVKVERPIKYLLRERKLYLGSVTSALFFCDIAQVSFAQSQALNCTSRKTFLKQQLLEQPNNCNSVSCPISLLFFCSPLTAIYSRLVRLFLVVWILKKKKKKEIKNRWHNFTFRDHQMKDWKHPVRE